MAAIARIMQATPLAEEHTAAIVSAIHDSRSENTRRTYATAMRRFNSWCDLHGYTDRMQPHVVGAYLADLSQSSSPSTVSVARAAILDAAGEYRSVLRTSEGITRVMEGASRRRRFHTAQQAPGLDPEQVKTILRVCGEDRSVRGLRDRAILFLAFSLGLRASDVCSLRVDGVTFVREGAEVVVPYSKTSDVPVSLALPKAVGEDTEMCPVTALRDWLDARTRLNLTTDHLFPGMFKGNHSPRDQGISTDALGSLLRTRATRAGVEIPGLSFHSCRASYATNALSAGYDTSAVMSTGRWASAQMVATYDRRSMWAQPASGWLSR